VAASQWRNVSKDARRTRVDYNEQRPHGSLDDRTPSEVSRQIELVKPAAKVHALK
jgi:transposase InsO family protein